MRFVIRITYFEGKDLPEQRQMEELRSDTLYDSLDQALEGLKEHRECQVVIRNSALCGEEELYRGDNDEKARKAVRKAFGETVCDVNPENRMQTYYGMQAEALLNTANQGDETVRMIRGMARSASFERIVLLGIGSSYHSASMAENEFQALARIPVNCMTPEQALRHLGEFNRKTLVIAVSQSGTSSNTLNLVREIRHMDSTVLAVTQGLASPIAKEAKAVIPLFIPDEQAGPKTMGVMASVSSLLLTSAALSENGDAWENLKKDLQAESEAMAANIPIVRDWVLGLSETLADEPSWMVVGQREAFAPAGECALKLTETVRRTAAVYELEEAVHGPLLSFAARPALLCLHLPWEDEVRPETLCGACEAKGGHAYRISLDSSLPRTEGTRVTLACRVKRLSLLELLLPAQAISAWIPPRMGIDLDRKDRDPFQEILAGHLDV